MGATTSSSSSSALPPKKYDVFLSFRGEDTRRTFTSHLHAALCQRHIETYIDEELPKGDEISPALIKAIEDSSISMVIFSENYASSKWCLNELAKILECKEDQGQLVIPVFYEVDPSHVRHQKGTYKDAFAKHEADFKHNQEVNKWKHALFEIANLAGWDSRNFRDESQLIRNIANDILQKLNHSYPSAFKDLVGIEENSIYLESLLEKVSIIGIWGMGGVGKTTMAKAIFAKLSSQFESCCFLENLREVSEKHGMTYIRDKLLLELLKEEESIVGSTFALKRLSRKKVFIVLDDVNSLNQLEYLAGEYHSIGPGSKVIITTRNKQLLKGRVHEIYEAKPLSYYKSLELFNLKAFPKHDFEIKYMELSKRAVAYADGNPLALIILGSFLHSKTPQEWDSALTKLKKTTHEDIQAVLKLSYDALNYEEREMFLDIACFLKGEAKEHVIALLDSYGFHASIGLRTLVDKALISINSINSTVWMHDLIQKMGWEIIHLECIEDPGRRSRLWDPKDVYNILKNNQGTDAIKGIILDLSQIRDIKLSANAFKKMINLRFLKFYSSNHEKSCIVNLPSGLKSFVDTLRYLQWDNFPLKSLPSTFCAKKLVELHMPNSHLKKLWDGVQDLVNLRKINLARSKQLVELPDFSKAQNLESMYLSSCESLCYVHPSILSLQRLAYLYLDWCINLKNLQSESHLKSLRWVFVRNCFSLKEFSLWADEIDWLYLDTTCIEILGSSIGHLRKLKELYLNCSTLKNLPVNEFYGLSSLQVLHLYNCGEIIDKSKLHILFDALKSLYTIKLDGSCKLIELPNNVKHLSRLRDLSLRDCKRLQSLPELPPSIEELDLTNCRKLRFLPELPPSTEFVRATNCISLETAFPSIAFTPKLKSLLLENCLKLEKHSLSRIMEWAYFSFKRRAYVNQTSVVCYPGRKFPRWFRYNQVTKASNFITIELSSPINNLVGFIFCSILPQFHPNLHYQSYLQCQIYCEDGKQIKCMGDDIYNMKFNSHHVFLWITNIPYVMIDELQKTKDDQDPNYKPKLSFEFSVTKDYFDIENEISKHDGLIEACGVYPIYASEYHKFLQQMELELELGTKKKNCHDTDEHSLCGIMEYASFSLKQAKCGNFERSIISSPGTTIPKWFSYKSSTTMASMFVQLVPDFDNSVDFIFYFVIPQFSKERDRSHSKCQCKCFGGLIVEGPRGWHYSMTKLNSDNVFLWYDPLYCERIRKYFLRNRGKNDEIEFQFEFGDCLIKECGVHPIDASEYKKFLQQKELKLELGTGKKRHRNIDNEQEQLLSTKKWKESSIVQPLPLSIKSTTSHDIDELLFTLSQLKLESTKDSTRQK